MIFRSVLVHKTGLYFSHIVTVKFWNLGYASLKQSWDHLLVFLFHERNCRRVELFFFEYLVKLVKMPRLLLVCFVN